MQQWYCTVSPIVAHWYLQESTDEFLDLVGENVTPRTCDVVYEISACT